MARPIFFSVCPGIMGKGLGTNICPGDGNLILNIGAFRSFTECIKFFFLTSYVLYIRVRDP